MENKANQGFFEKVFHLSEHHTDVKTEIIAGITTFMTMAYILAVNPNILSATGMDRGAVFTATALASLVATLLMAAFANYPFVLAPGMGLNAYFAYTVVLQMGYTWQMALAAVFVEGVIFILLSLTNVREAIFNAIPMNLKHAVSAGIGLFIAFIGLQNAKIVVDSATLVSVFSFKGSLEAGTFNSVGITVLLALLGVLITGILSLNFVTIMFAFLFVDMFDTLGTLIGVASKADMLDKDGKLPKIRGALLSDAIGTSLGAVFGTSTTTTFVESASGVAEGGRTGLTSVVAAIFFGLSLFLSPIFLAIPSFATAPALIIVGFLMISSVLKIDFNDFTEAIPSYIAIIAMPFMYSISEGIAMGVISYVVINVVTGHAKDKKISLLMYILAVLFVLKYVLI